MKKFINFWAVCLQDFFLRRKTVTAFLLIAIIFVSAKSYSQLAPVNPPAGGFRIDGGLKANTPTAHEGDWVYGPGGTGDSVIRYSGVPFNATTTKLIRDPFNDAADKIFSGSSFSDNPNTTPGVSGGWKWTTGAASNKCDINNALFFSTTSATNKWVILGGDRLATTGTSYIDFEFYQGDLTRNADGTFSSVMHGGGSLAATGGRTPADFVLSMEYSNGGTTALVHYYSWENSGGWKYVEHPIPAPGGVVSAFGATNGVATDVPFGAFGTNSYIPYAFVEAAVNIDAILSGQCQSLSIHTIFVKTKASDSYNAALKDFVEPQAVSFVFGNAGLNYGGPDVCHSGTLVPTVPSTPQGTFTASPNTLVINSSTGVIDLAASPTGGYKITYTPSGGVCLQPATDSINIHPLPSIANKTATICSGGTFTTTPTDGGGDVVPSGTTYTWSAPVISNSAGNITGGSAQPSGQTSISQTLTNTTNTVQTATYTVTPTSGTCAGATFTVTVTVNPKPTIANKTATICSGATFTVTPTNGGGDIVPSGTTYTWSAPVISNSAGNITGGSAQPSGQSSISQTLTNTTNTVQTATYTVTPTSGTCAGTTFTVTVTVNPKPTIAAKIPGICSGGTFTVTPTNGGGDIVPSGTTYTWSAPVISNSAGNITGGSAQASGQSSISQTLTNTTNAVQTATYTVTPVAGTCTGATFTVTVTVNPKPTIANKSATICSGSTFNVAPTNGGGDIVPVGTTYTWSAPVISNSAGNITGGSAQASGQSSISQTLTNTTNSAQTATYTVTPTAGTCPGATFTVTVTVNPSLLANVTYNSPACDEDTFSVTVISPNPGATYTIVNKNGATMPNVRVNHGTTTSSYLAPNSNNFSFTNIPAGSGYQVTGTIGSCSSTTNSCGQASVNSAVNQNGAALRTTTQTLQLEGSRVSIKAYPNPFNDKVNFVITSLQAGNGSLEVVNMLGQKMKTVFEGHINAGSQSFEMSLGGQQPSTIIYIFRMGDKQVTGKLLQLGQ